MLNIRSVSDLRNKFGEVEKTVIEEGQPVFLTKNSYGSMAVMSLEQYNLLTDQVERALDLADLQANTSQERLSAG